VSEVVLVWGGDPLILDLLPQDPRLKTLECRDHALGMGESLSAGLEALDPDSDGTFVFLGDMPQVPVGLTGALAQAVAGGAVAAAPSFNGKRGHPVLISSSLFRALSALRGDQGAGPVLAGLGTGLVLIPAPDDGCLFDIDRPEDLGIRADLASGRPKP
jgi:molybdenum cofactor cytidylyltransferase